MGLLDQILGGAQGTPSPADASGALHSGLVEHVLGMVSNNQAGGLGGLVQKLSSGGLGSAVASWVGTGPNQAVTGDQVQAALGSDQIAQLAQKFGIPPEMVASHLSQILPQIINHLTPDGTVPHPTIIQSAIGLLKAKLMG